MNFARTAIERLQLRDGTSLHCQAALSESAADPWLIGVHGIGEYLDREARLPELFSNQYNVFQYDLRGHGRSDGRRGYVDSFEVHYRDLEEVIVHLAEKYHDFRYILFGHSMGALIAAGFVQKRSSRVPQPERLFLASPPIGLGGLGGALVNRLPRSLVSGLNRLPLSLPIGSTINRHYLSHDKEVAIRLERDPLVLKRLHSKLLFALVDASRTVFSRPIGADGPIYAAIGDADHIVSCSAAQRYFALHEPAADFRVFEGAYHELHNETSRYREPYLAFLAEALARRKV